MLKFRKVLFFDNFLKIIVHFKTNHDMQVGFMM